MPVLYNGGNTVDNAGLNTYSPKRYWPYDEANNKLAFYAYYPKENGGEITPNVTAGLGTYSVKVPADPASQSDFLVSDLKVDQVYSKTPFCLPLRWGVPTLPLTSSCSLRNWQTTSLRTSCSRFPPKALSR